MSDQYWPGTVPATQSTYPQVAGVAGVNRVNAPMQQARFLGAGGNVGELRDDEYFSPSRLSVVPLPYQHAAPPPPPQHFYSGQQPVNATASSNWQPYTYSAIGGLPEQASVAPTTEYRFPCDLCKLDFADEKEYQYHCQGISHILAVREQGRKVAQLQCKPHTGTGTNAQTPLQDIEARWKNPSGPTPVPPPVSYPVTTYPFSGVIAKPGLGTSAGSSYPGSLTHSPNNQNQSSLHGPLKNKNPNEETRHQNDSWEQSTQSCSTNPQQKMIPPNVLQQLLKKFKCYCPICCVKYGTAGEFEEHLYGTDHWKNYYSVQSILGGLYIRKWIPEFPCPGPKAFDQMVLKMEKTILENVTALAGLIPWTDAMEEAYRISLYESFVATGGKCQICDLSICKLHEWVFHIGGTPHTNMVLAALSRLGTDGFMKLYRNYPLMNPKRIENTDGLKQIQTLAQSWLQQLKAKPPCKFGSGCYRQFSKEHRDTFYHPPIMKPRQNGKAALPWLSTAASQEQEDASQAPTGADPMWQHQVLPDPLTANSSWPPGGKIFQSNIELSGNIKSAGAKANRTQWKHDTLNKQSQPVKKPWQKGPASNKDTIDDEWEHPLLKKKRLAEQGQQQEENTQLPWQQTLNPAPKSWQPQQQLTAAQTAWQQHVVPTQQNQNSFNQSNILPNTWDHPYLPQTSVAGVGATPMGPEMGWTGPGAKTPPWLLGGNLNMSTPPGTSTMSSGYEYDGNQSVQSGHGVSQQIFPIGASHVGPPAPVAQQVPVVMGQTVGPSSMVGAPLTNSSPPKTTLSQLQATLKAVKSAPWLSGSHPAPGQPGVTREHSSHFSPVGATIQHQLHTNLASSNQVLPLERSSLGAYPANGNRSKTFATGGSGLSFDPSPHRQSSKLGQANDEYFPPIKNDLDNAVIRGIHEKLMRKDTDDRMDEDRHHREGRKRTRSRSPRHDVRLGNDGKDIDDRSIKSRFAEDRQSGLLSNDGGRAPEKSRSHSSNLDRKGDKSYTEREHHYHDGKRGSKLLKKTSEQDHHHHERRDQSRSQERRGNQEAHQHSRKESYHHGEKERIGTFDERLDERNDRSYPRDDRKESHHYQWRDDHSHHDISIHGRKDGSYPHERRDDRRRHGSYERRDDERRHDEKRHESYPHEKRDTGERRDEPHLRERKEDGDERRQSYSHDGMDDGERRHESYPHERRDERRHGSYPHERRHGSYPHESRDDNDRRHSPYSHERRHGSHSHERRDDDERRHGSHSHERRDDERRHGYHPHERRDDERRHGSHPRESREHSERRHGSHPHERRDDERRGDDEDEMRHERRDDGGRRNEPYFHGKSGDDSYLHERNEFHQERRDDNYYPEKTVDSYQPGEGRGLHHERHAVPMETGNKGLTFLKDVIMSFKKKDHGSQHEREDGAWPGAGSYHDGRKELYNCDKREGYDHDERRGASSHYERGEGPLHLIGKERNPYGSTDSPFLEDQEELWHYAVTAPNQMNASRPERVRVKPRENECKGEPHLQKLVNKDGIVKSESGNETKAKPHPQKLVDNDGIMKTEGEKESNKSETLDEGDLIIDTSPEQQRSIAKPRIVLHNVPNKTGTLVPKMNIFAQKMGVTKKIEGGLFPARLKKGIKLEKEESQTTEKETKAAPPAERDPLKVEQLHMTQSGGDISKPQHLKTASPSKTKGTAQDKTVGAEKKSPALIDKTAKSAAKKTVQGNSPRKGSNQQQKAVSSPGPASASEIKTTGSVASVSVLGKTKQSAEVKCETSVGTGASPNKGIAVKKTCVASPVDKRISRPDNATKTNTIISPAKKMTSAPCTAIKTTTGGSSSIEKSDLQSCNAAKASTVVTSPAKIGTSQLSKTAEVKSISPCKVKEQGERSNMAGKQQTTEVKSKKSTDVGQQPSEGGKANAQKREMTKAAGEKEVPKTDKKTQMHVNNSKDRNEYRQAAVKKAIVKTATKKGSLQATVKKPIALTAAKKPIAQTTAKTPIIRTAAQKANVGAVAKKGTTQIAAKKAVLQASKLTQSSMKKAAVPTGKVISTAVKKSGQRQVQQPTGKSLPASRTNHHLKVMKSPCEKAGSSSNQQLKRGAVDHEQNHRSESFHSTAVDKFSHRHSGGSEKSFTRKTRDTEGSGHHQEDPHWMGHQPNHTHMRKEERAMHAQQGPGRYKQRVYRYHEGPTKRSLERNHVRDLEHGQDTRGHSHERQSRRELVREQPEHFVEHRDDYEMWDHENYDHDKSRKDFEGHRQKERRREFKGHRHDEPQRDFEGHRHDEPRRDFEGHHHDESQREFESHHPDGSQRDFDHRHDEPRRDFDGHHHNESGRNFESYHQDEPRRKFAGHRHDEPRRDPEVHRHDKPGKNFEGHYDESRREFESHHRDGPRRDFDHRHDEPRGHFEGRDESVRESGGHHCDKPRRKFESRRHDEPQRDFDGRHYDGSREEFEKHHHEDGVPGEDYDESYHVDEEFYDEEVYDIDDRQHDADERMFHHPSRGHGGSRRERRHVTRQDQDERQHYDGVHHPDQQGEQMRPDEENKWDMEDWQRSEVIHHLPSQYLPEDVEKFYQVLADNMHILITNFHDMQSYTPEAILQSLTEEDQSAVMSVQEMTGVKDMAAAAQLIYVLRGMDEEVVTVLGNLHPDILQSLASQDPRSKEHGMISVQTMFDSLGFGQKHNQEPGYHDEAGWHHAGKHEEYHDNRRTDRKRSWQGARGRGGQWRGKRGRLN